MEKNKNLNDVGDKYKSLIPKPITNANFKNLNNINPTKNFDHKKLVKRYEVLMQETFFDLEIRKIKSAGSAKEFYESIGELIKIIHLFNNKQIDTIAEIVKQPWKPKQGAKLKKERLSKIRIYIISAFMNDEKIKRQSIIRYIVDSHKLTFEAATKIYNQLRKDPRLKGYIKFLTGKK